MTRWLWVGLFGIPLLVGVITGFVSIARDCDWDYDSADVFLVEFLLLPFLMAGWGLLAGVVSLRPRGRAIAFLGAVGGCVLGFVWTLVALYVSLAVLTGLGC